MTFYNFDNSATEQLSGPPSTGNNFSDQQPFLHIWPYHEINLASARKRTDRILRTSASFRSLGFLLLAQSSRVLLDVRRQPVPKQ